MQNIMQSQTPVSRALSDKGVTHRQFHHSGPITSLQQAAQERGQRPEQVVRSIVFRLSQDEFVMVLVSGPEQVSWSALRSHLGRSRLTMASQEEVLAKTGYEIGAVSPFGLPDPMKILVDQGILEEEEISIGSGTRGVTIILNSRDFIYALEDYEFGRFKSD